MQEKEATLNPFGGKLSFFFNVAVLCLSIGLMLYIIFGWGFWDHVIVLTYVASALISLLFFHSLKIILLKNLSSRIEDVEDPGHSEGLGKKQIFLLLIAISLMLMVPVIILYIVPDYWLIILNGIIAGASVSELIFYFKRRK